MNISMYNASVPQFIRMLNNLKNILEKAASFAEQKRIDTKVLASYRLAPDMLPLSAQVQIACDTAKGCGARLAGVEMPRHEDNEKTITELAARVDSTIAFLKTLTAEQIDGSEDKHIVLKFPNSSFEFKGLNYLLGFAQPNFYFHCTTAYAILRHCGVEIGKMDYLGGA
ncbi:MAG: DUF1993 domain-containing protein [Gammaproteobacteria bacterium]